MHEFNRCGGCIIRCMAKGMKTNSNGAGREPPFFTQKDITARMRVAKVAVYRKGSVQAQGCSCAERRYNLQLRLGNLDRTFV